MGDTNMIETMQSAAEQLSPVLWNAYWEALQDAERRMHGLAHEKYPMLRPLVARACLREVLTAGGELPNGWRVAGSPQRMGQLLVESDRVCARFLKESSTVFPGGVPAAGRNGARQAFWQPSLLEVEDEGAPALNLLLLWDYVDPGRVEEGFTLRLVHPKGKGAFGSQTPIDASIPLSDDIGVLKALRFVDNQENPLEDFFAQIDAEEAIADGFGE